MLVDTAAVILRFQILIRIFINVLRIFFFVSCLNFDHKNLSQIAVIILCSNINLNPSPNPNPNPNQHFICHVLTLMD